MNPSVVRRIAIAIAFSGALALGFGAPDPIRVLTLDGQRSGTCSSINWTFSTGNAFSTVRNQLLLPANFGPTGLVQRPIELLPAANRFDYFALAAADVVLVSQVNQRVDSCELLELSRFVDQGGGLFVFANEAAIDFSELVGAVGGGNGAGCASISNAATPVTAGPFGNVGGCIAPNFHRRFASIGAGTTFLSDGQPVGAFFPVGAGRVVLICDEEWCTSVSVGGCAVGSLTSPEANRIRLFLNSVAYVTPAPDFVFNGPERLLGDANCDCLVNNFDIDAFVLAVLDPIGHAANYPGCDLLNSDANLDGLVNNFDIDGFVAILTQQ
ncbi:MAG: hypothetical protein IPM64_15515 [Phycisphaerales bacterium]|nr:hypothetical protein [Phycisphaerales bacterium]